jgi:hypothetical protein
MAAQDTPPNCTPTEGASLGEVAYCRYNYGGKPELRGINYQGKPCPTFAELADLPNGKNIQLKWQHVAQQAAREQRIATRTAMNRLLTAANEMLAKRGVAQGLPWELVDIVWAELGGKDTDSDTEEEKE